MSLFVFAVWCYFCLFNLLLGVRRRLLCVVNCVLVVDSDCCLLLRVWWLLVFVGVCCSLFVVRCLFLFVCLVCVVCCGLWVVGCGCGSLCHVG